MGLFKKRKKIVDLSEGYSRSFPRKSSKDTVDLRNGNEENSGSALGFLGDIANSGSDSSSSDSISWDNDSPSSSSSGTVGEFHEKKQKLAKRLLAMTDKIEDLSNQIYHLKQRIELLEKKTKIGYD